MKYRFREYSEIHLHAENGFLFSLTYLNRRAEIIESILNIIRTLFICLILGLFGYLFQRVVLRVFLHPIERMIEKVRMLAKNPLLATHAKFDKVGMLKFVHSEYDKNSEVKSAEELDLETATLERTLVKIGKLLALSFGEAGSQLIGQNLSSQGDLNPMMQGTCIYAIFGFCDIRCFTDSTEVMEAKVLVFVNQIAEICHSQVHKYGG